jgi:putative peptide zinc metalloprotease protein
MVFANDDLICPNLSLYWRLEANVNDGSWSLRSNQRRCSTRFTKYEYYALKHFTGEYTVRQIEEIVCSKFGEKKVSIFQLLSRLIELGVLLINDEDIVETFTVKPRVRWTYQTEGYWILGDYQGLRHLQVSNDDRIIIDAVFDCIDHRASINSLKPHLACDGEKVEKLVGQLVSAQFIRTQPGSNGRQYIFDNDYLPCDGKNFNPFKHPRQILFHKKPFFPKFLDDLLAQLVKPLWWVWKWQTFLLMILFLIVSLTALSAQQDNLLRFGEKLILVYSWNLVIPFALFSAIVIGLHELSHALTLKHFKGKIREIGLFLMMFFPAVYVNVSDAYHLKRKERCLVLLAGILCQLVIASVAFWLWLCISEGYWLRSASYLLLTSALFTVALNLNPMARFDGYYLISAVLGINNLRSRAFKLLGKFREEGIQSLNSFESNLLFIYASLNFLYILSIASKFIFWISASVILNASFVLISAALILFLPCIAFHKFEQSWLLPDKSGKKQEK